ncbi:kinectin-like isoform X2 [Polypterus senegalus]|nr:kinectin-like isoform X2 [Polypterus senegalus]XP_039598218.1 kinectin-like isoform X2 [Polypterus senegalus]
MRILLAAADENNLILQDSYVCIESELSKQEKEMKQLRDTISRNMEETKMLEMKTQNLKHLTECILEEFPNLVQKRQEMENEESADPDMRLEESQSKQAGNEQVGSSGQAEHLEQHSFTGSSSRKQWERLSEQKNVNMQEATYENMSLEQMKIILQQKMDEAILLDDIYVNLKHQVLKQGNVIRELNEELEVITLEKKKREREFHRLKHLTECIQEEFHTLLKKDQQTGRDERDGEVPETSNANISD